MAAFASCLAGLNYRVLSARPCFRIPMVNFVLQLGCLIILIALPFGGVAQESAASKEKFEITFDVYFFEEFLGDTLTLIDAQGNLLALDTALLAKKLPPLLEDLGVFDHPLQKTPLVAGYLDEAAWRRYGIILEPDPGAFSVRVKLSPLYRPIQGLSVYRFRQEKSTLLPAERRGWLSFSSRVVHSPGQPIGNSGFWRGGAAVKDWFLFANGKYDTKTGIFGSTGTDILNTWRIERSEWGKWRNSLQFGWIEAPQVVDGQGGSGGVRGMALGRTFNPLHTNRILKELPGGLIEIEEDSELEIFVDGVLQKKFTLAAGRFRLKDLFLSDGIHAIDLRVTTNSGRVDERRVTLERYFSQISKGETEYVVFGGQKPPAGGGLALRGTPVLGGALRHGFAAGITAGVHGNFGEEGYRSGVSFETRFEKARAGFSAWWQNRKSQRGFFRAGLDFGGRFMGFGGGIEISSFKPGEGTATSRDRELNLSIAPKWDDWPIADLNFGLVHQVNGEKGFFFRATRGWTIFNNLTLTATMSKNTLNDTLQGFLSITYKPTNSTSTSISRSVGSGGEPLTRLNANKTFLNNRVRVGLDRSFAQKTGRLRLNEQWNDDRVRLRGEQQWTESSSGKLALDQASLTSETALLYADGSWAVVPDTAGTFLVVDASALEHSDKLKVILGGRRRLGMFGRVSEGRLKRHSANRLKLDPTEVGFGLEVREEIINPTPGQAFRVVLEPRVSLAAVGKLLLPSGEPLANGTGMLRHVEKGAETVWFTGSDGDFFYEGEPGVWRGSVYWKGKRFVLRIVLSKEQAVEGVVVLGDVRLLSAE